MKRILLFLILVGSAHAAGSVQQSLQAIGSNPQNPTTQVLSFIWTGDATTGSVPSTVATLQCCLGWFPVQVEFVPGTPNPTAGYSVTITDVAGFDILGGAAASLSATAVQSFATSTAAPPIQGALTLNITGQSVASAKGTVYIFMNRPGTFNSAKLGVGVASGPNWLAIANPPFADARVYNFTPQTPGSSLSSGACSFVMTPVPSGVVANGNLYISGGVGTAESVPITSIVGTTINATCANTHSGAWTVQSVMAGIPEANAANPGAMVWEPNNVTAFGSSIFQSTGGLQCAPGATITWSGASGGANYVFQIAANNVVIQGCIIAGGSAAAIITNSGTHSGMRVDRNQLSGSQQPVYFTAGTDIDVTNNHISGFTGFGVLTNAIGVNYVRVMGNFIDTTSTTTTNGCGIELFGSHSTITGNTVLVGGHVDQGILFLNNPGVGLTDVAIVGNTVTISGANGFECIGVGSADRFSITGNTCKVTTTATGASLYGIEINRSNYGTVSGNTIDLNNPNGTVSAIGIIVESASFNSISGNTIAGWGNGSGGSGASYGVWLINTIASATLQGNIVSNNTLQNTAASGSSAADLTVDSLGAGTVTQNVFQGNYIESLSTSGHMCIKILNSGAGTATNQRASGNTCNNADTGIQVAANTNATLDNNRITNSATATYNDMGTATKIVDFDSGVPFSFLSTQQNGSVVYCTNCTIANPCNSGGTGAIAKRLNGVWVCN